MVAIAALGGAAAGPAAQRWLGAASARGAVILLVAAALVLAWAWRSRVVVGVALAAALCTVGLSVRALVPLEALRPGRVDGPVVLRSDPSPFFGTIEVIVSHRGRRLLASMDGPAAGEVAGLQVGDTMRITGRTSRFINPTPWHRSRHLAGEVHVDSVADVEAGRGAFALASGVRERIRSSVEPLEPDARALVLGAALGDDRSQSDAQRDRFLRSGLTHLLVVSGQNVALMLVLCAPWLARVPIVRRPWATAAVVGWFVLVVRPDPSVLRAAAAALVVALATGRGQRLDAPTVLAGALTAVVIVDPLVVGSLGFWLSAAATLGLVVGLGGHRGSDWNPAVIGRATLAAQVGVAPVLALAGLGVPVASFPANIAAGAPAGLLTGWGMTVGLVAGSLPVPLAWVARLPVVVAAWWVDGVARWSARLPLGRFTPGEILVLVIAGALTLVAWVTWFGSVGRAVPNMGNAVRPTTGRSARFRWLLVAPLATVVCVAGWPRTVTGGAVPGGCLVARRGAIVLVLQTSPPTRRLLQALAEAEVRHLDVLRVAPGGLRMAETTVSVRDAVPVGEVRTLDDGASAPACPTDPTTDPATGPATDPATGPATSGG